MPKIEIRIDRKTLPKDKQAVRFEVDNGNLYEGEFCEGDDIFHVADDLWFFSWRVSSWEPVHETDETSPTIPASVQDGVTYNKAIDDAIKATLAFYVSIYSPYPESLITKLQSLKKK